MKSHPIQQAGKLNGVGGKLNAGEFSTSAMIRESSEEVVGLDSPNTTQWRHFARIRFTRTNSVLYCFETTVYNQSEFIELRSNDSLEPISPVDIDMLTMLERRGRLVTHVNFLVQAALSRTMATMYLNDFG